MTEEIKADGRLYWALAFREVIFLVPKKRGKGFLRTPIGHHTNDLSRFFSMELGLDSFGLDGYVRVPSGFTHGREGVIYGEIVEPFAKFLNTEAVKVKHGDLMDYVISSNKRFK